MVSARTQRRVALVQRIVVRCRGVPAASPCARCVRLDLVCYAASFHPACSGCARGGLASCEAMASSVDAECELGLPSFSCRGS